MSDLAFHEQLIDRIARGLGLKISRISSSGKNLPAGVTPGDRLLVEQLRPYTMTSPERLWSLIEGVRFVI